MEPNENRRYEPAAPPPGQPPRVVPDRPVRGLAVLRSGLFVMGLMFTVIPAIIVVIGLVLLLTGVWFGIFITLFPMIHLAIGLMLLRSSVRTDDGRRQLARDGLTTTGHVSLLESHDPTSRSSVDRWTIRYDYEVDGATHRGHTTTTDTAVTMYRVGDPIWVVYEPGNPANSVEWPLLDSGLDIIRLGERGRRRRSPRSAHRD